MSLRPKWQNIRERNWEKVRNEWLAHVPNFPGLGVPPDPGLEHFSPLLEISLPKDGDPPSRMSDVDGIRRNALWEAVFLFHKCAHVNLASQRLGQRGMLSWCLFNSYHSAYLGARGVMTLLGVALPKLAGQQVAIDLFPEPVKKKGQNRPSGYPQIQSQAQDFLIIRLPSLLDQRHVWEAFQRVLRVSDAECWDKSIREELMDLSYEAISPPRNHFLYQAHFWPLDDLISDSPLERMNDLFGTELDAEDQGFLLRLCFCVYRIFEQLLTDLATISAVINEQLEGSRFLAKQELPELSPYKLFLSQMAPPIGL